MQSGLGKINKWILEFETKDPTINPLMGWESSTHTLSEVKLEFTNKENAIKYAKKNKLTWREDKSNTENKYLRNKISFENIYEFHTKSHNTWRNDLTNFLLDSFMNQKN